MAGEGWNGGDYDPSDPPKGGLAAARMTAMLTYRAPQSVDERFNRDLASDNQRRPRAEDEIAVQTHKNPAAVASLPFYDVENYLRYQGKKFTRRFDPNCYVQLTLTLDTHDVSAGRGAYTDVLASLKHKTMVVGITSDVLYPYHLQRSWWGTCPTRRCTIDSPTGTTPFSWRSTDSTSPSPTGDEGPGRASKPGALTTRSTASSARRDRTFRGLPAGDSPVRVVDAKLSPASEPFFRSQRANRTRIKRTGIHRLACFEARRRSGVRRGHGPPRLPAGPRGAPATPRSRRRRPVVRHARGRSSRRRRDRARGRCVAYRGGVVIDTPDEAHLRGDGEQLAVVGAEVLKSKLNKLEPSACSSALIRRQPSSAGWPAPAAAA